MNLQEIIELLNNPNNFPSSEQSSIKNPFDFSGIKYLHFAEADLESNLKHKYVNALSNAKRALDCQLELLLIAFGFYRISKKEGWNIPKKLNTLKSIAVVTPRILNKINKLRNKVEHDFLKPNSEQVEDFVDVTSLFIESTKRYIISLPTLLEGRHQIDGKLSINIELLYKEGRISIKQRTPTKQIEIIEIKSIDSAYIEFLKVYLKAGYKE